MNYTFASRLPSKDSTEAHTGPDDALVPSPTSRLARSASRFPRWQGRCCSQVINHSTERGRAMKVSIREVMTPNPKTVAQSATIMEAACAMRDNDIGDVVVVENGRLCGILTD